ncbi:MAG: hypothetical protein ABI378_04975, partial [Chitinophagaceae bacterium]
VFLLEQNELIDSSIKLVKKSICFWLFIDLHFTMLGKISPCSRKLTAWLLPHWSTLELVNLSVCFFEVY